LCAHPPAATRDALDLQARAWVGAAAGADHLLETDIPGVFAAGDLRSGSIKRCATAVGEGAMAVQFVHGHLSRTPAVGEVT
jgi:thioredoxin reductase (NADPH)